MNEKKPDDLAVEPPSLGAEVEDERIRALLKSPAYRRADRDLGFLEKDDVRHVRLELEFLKPDLAMRDHHVESVIVLFGGTRIVEEGVARRRRDACRAAVDEDPDDPAKRRALAVAERVLAKSKYYDVAREFGRLVSERSAAIAPHDFVIMTGGGPGIMEAGNRGACDSGRKSIGLNIELPFEQYPNPYITPGLCFQFRYFAIRKLHFLLRAKALVAFPGGYGTFDELFDALCLVQTKKIEPMPIILVGEAFWRSAFPAEVLADEGVIDDRDLGLFRYAETAEEIWQQIAAWYRVNGGEDESPKEKT